VPDELASISLLGKDDLDGLEQELKTALVQVTADCVWTLLLLSDW
jgi:hypothetical protein